MAQHDYNIANADGASVRADLNNALSAGVSLNSGASAPSTTFAYMLWADTTTGLLKIRNAADSAWITVGTLASANLGLQRAAKGADIASASPLVLGTDGSYFDVTGTTGFSTITVAAGVGLFMLQFDGALTMTDGASLDLGGANITTAAGDRGVFFATAANTVKMLSFQRQGVPSAAKVWVKFDQAGTVNASFNVDSVTDTGVGDWTVNIATDFSSVDYSALAGWRSDVGGVGPGNDRHVYVGAQAVGSFQFRMRDISAATAGDPNAAADDMHAQAFGDQ